MPTVVFTRNLQRHVDCPSVVVAGTTVAEALVAVFEANPRLRGYVVNEHGSLRKHMNIFVDGTQILDRANLTDPVRSESEIYVMQAISGG